MKSIFNRAPLLPNTCTPLSPGAVRPEGWLGAQLKAFEEAVCEDTQKFFEGEGGWERELYAFEALTILAYTQENAALKEPQETWLLIRSGVWDASEGDIGWVPLECVTEYTAENMYTVAHPLKVDASAIDWNYGFVSCSDSSGIEVTVGYHGGGEATIPADCLLYPEPGVTGWFD